MTILIKSAIAAAAFGGLAATASADTSFQASFEFTPSAPAETIYADFEKSAKRACRVDSREVGGIGQKSTIERKCRAELMDKAVQATGMATLIALHESTGARNRQYANAK